VAVSESLVLCYRKGYKACVNGFLSAHSPASYSSGGPVGRQSFNKRLRFLFFDFKKAAPRAFWRSVMFLEESPPASQSIGSRQVARLSKDQSGRSYAFR